MGAGSRAGVLVETLRPQPTSRVRIFRETMRPLRPKPLASSSPPPTSDSENFASLRSGNSVAGSSSTGAGSAYTPSTPGTDVGLVDDLESTTRAIVHAFNERDYSNPIIVDNIATDFCFESDFVQACSTLDEYLNMCRSMDAMYPKYHLRILDISTEFEKGHEDADVLVSFEITGAPENVKRQRMSVCKWKKEDNRWQWCRHISMRMPVTEFVESVRRASPPG